MIFLVSNLCFYSRQSLGVFLLCSVPYKFLKFNSPDASHHSELKISQIPRMCDPGEYVTKKILHMSSSAMPVVLTSLNLFRVSFLANVTICCRPSVVVCLSVGNARTPYSGGSNLPQYFYGIRYLGHPLTSIENFTEIVPGEPLRRGS